MAKRTGVKNPGQLRHAGQRVREASNDWISRLAGHVTVSPSGCWLVGTDPTTYPVCFLGGRRVRTHRAVYELIVEDIAPGNHVHHECEMPACINPAHLVQLTPEEHVARHRRLRARDGR